MSRRYIATSLIEVAISLVVAAILLETMRYSITSVRMQYQQLVIEQQFAEISRAAADYALRNGYLPLPEGVVLGDDCPTHDRLARLQLRGRVPWQELKLQPPRNSHKFVWIVSPTAVHRGQDWKYSTATHHVHLLPNFWANPRWATFARPRWCGLHEAIWWGGVESVSRGLQSYLATKSEYPYTLQVYTRQMGGECIRKPITPTWLLLQPQLPGLISLGPGLHAKLFELYELESRLSLYTCAWSTTTYSAMTEWLQKVAGAGAGPASEQSVPYLSPASLSNSRDTNICYAAFLGQVYRAVWVDEPVLALAHEETPGLPPVGVGPHSAYVVLSTADVVPAVVWGRAALLALVNYHDNYVYTSPGYGWVQAVEPRVAPYETPQDLKPQVGSFGESAIKILASNGRFFRVGKLDKHKDNRFVAMCSGKYAGTYPATAYDVAGLAVRGSTEVVTLLPTQYGAVGALLPMTDFFLQWYEVILGLDGLEPLRANTSDAQYGAPVTLSDYTDQKRELQIWLAVLTSVTAGVRALVDQMESTAAGS